MSEVGRFKGRKPESTLSPHGGDEPGIVGHAALTSVGYSCALAVEHSGYTKFGDFGVPLDEANEFVVGRTFTAARSLAQSGPPNRD
jgi:hypothetical protein